MEQSISKKKNWSSMSNCFQFFWNGCFVVKLKYCLVPLDNYELPTCMGCQNCTIPDSRKSDMKLKVNQGLYRIGVELYDS